MESPLEEELEAVVGEGDSLLDDFFVVEHDLLWGINREWDAGTFFVGQGELLEVAVLQEIRVDA